MCCLVDDTPRQFDPESGGTIISGALLRKRRERLYLTQCELASLADCSRASLANIEGGYTPKSSRVMERIEAALERLEAGGGECE